FRIGAVALPCTEQLRASDLRARMDAAEPVAVLCDRRNADTVRDAGFAGTLLVVPDESLFEAAAAPAADLGERDPALLVFTSGTSGTPKPIRHGQRYLAGQHVQAEHWFGARPGELAWCTAASGWSKSARNSFIAPWLRGATALLHDARFDPAERLELIERERVAVLCMAPTEYRVMAKRTELRAMPTLRHAVAAGEPLNPEIVHLWQDRVGVSVHDGYGQTETGALTGMPLDRPVRPGSMGVALPGFDLWIDEGELCVDPATVPTFFLDGPEGPWRTGDRVSRDDDGYLWFEGRTDDVIISAGYRIGPFEVESALVAHPDVAEAAAVAAPDEERGQVVRAVVVLREGTRPGDELARALQEHVKEQTAPYKYPRIVEFADALPKTASGKIKRAELRRRD
ncbi:MAG TPA: AMP-binding protein, partial [Thermoleophilaceae bacterium]|nr:AMP-binding protein [Thermoleophilaceae bacterium]